MTQTVEPPAEVPAELRISTGQAADITGLTSRTIERYVDGNTLRGGRPLHPVTRKPIPLTWRWVHAGDAVMMAIDLGRRDQIPPEWAHLIPQQPGGEHHAP